MFQTETHLHTKEVSPCAHLTAEKMVEYYHHAGYQTLFVSDHMHADCQGAEWFLTGYHQAKKAGDRYGMNILLSAEYSFLIHGVPNHYLVYGIDEDFIRHHVNGPDFDLGKLQKAVKECGGLIIQAHPFRGIGIPTPDFVDGMEVFNSNPRHFVKTDEQRTEAMTGLYHLLRTAGSDAHRPEDVAGTGIGSEHEIKTASDFIELIQSGKGTILKNIK